jgi:hypothetical protein
MLEDANAFVVWLDAQRARWLADYGEVVEAVRHAGAAGDWNDAAQLVTDQSFRWVLDGQAGRSAGLRSFPDHQIPASPVHHVRSHDHRVAIAAGVCTIRTEGRLGDAGMSAVFSMVCQLTGVETVCSSVAGDVHGTPPLLLTAWRTGAGYDMAALIKALAR